MNAKNFAAKITNQINLGTKDDQHKAWQDENVADETPTMGDYMILEDFQDRYNHWDRMGR